MSYQVTRHADDKPAGRMHVMIDHPPADSTDAGFGLGGSFYFEPGETLVMPEYSARVIMRDPVLQHRFSVDPPLPELPEDVVPDEEPAAPEALTVAPESPEPVAPPPLAQPSTAVLPAVPLVHRDAE